MSKLTHLTVSQIGQVARLAEKALNGRASKDLEAFTDYVETLPREAAVELIAVMYHGRDDPWPYIVSHCDKNFSDNTRIAEQMIGKTPLIEYLMKGLARLTLDEQP